LVYEYRQDNALLGRQDKQNKQDKAKGKTTLRWQDNEARQKRTGRARKGESKLSLSLNLNFLYFSFELSHSEFNP